MSDVTGTASDLPRSARSGSSFFTVYKWPQGYYTRVGTLVGCGILILGAGDFIWDQLAFDQDWKWGLPLRVAITVSVVIVLGGLLYWVACVNRKSCDFLIATDGEMKKVNWTSRREIISSTKVVIVVTVLMALLLFFVDWGFMRFFRMIGVLRGGG